MDYGDNSYSEFSYVVDERVDCSKEAWAYSLYYRSKYFPTPICEARCTYDLLNNLLPEINAKGEPTGQKLTDSTLTVHPIGLY
jgi:hypothetical protein